MEGLQVIKATLPVDTKYIEIVAIGDVHSGDDWCDEQAVKEVINYVLEKPYRYVILNGDLINNAIKTAISDVYGSNDPEMEIRHVARLFMPIKDRILAMGSGNHEERTLKLTGIDPSRYIAIRLGVEDKYASNSFLLFLSVGRSHTYRQVHKHVRQQVYSIFVQHGYGGGKKSGSKLNNLNASDGIVPNADIYVMGHTHDPMANSKRTFVCDYQNRQIYEHKKYYLMHNAYLDYGGYGLRQGFPPSSKELMYARLYTQGRKHIQIVMGMEKEID